MTIVIVALPGARRAGPGKSRKSQPANLTLPYTGQNRAHNCLLDRTVDALAVDQPIYDWVATGDGSVTSDAILFLKARSCR